MLIPVVRISADYNEVSFMKKIFKASLVLLCLSLVFLLAACGGGGGAGGDSTPKTKSVSVTLKDNSDNAIVGATVALVDSEGAVKYSATTSDAGVADFTVNDGEEKSLLAKVTALPEGTLASSEELALTHSVESLSANIVLSLPTYIFKAEFDGEPVVGLTISLYKASNNAKLSTAVTDANGNAIFTVDPGAYKAIASLSPTDPFEVKDKTVKTSDAGKSIALELVAAKGLSESDPITYTDIKHEFVASVRAEGQTWFKLSYEIGAYVIFNSDNAVVTYAGTEYKAKSGEDFVKVELADPSGDKGDAIFSVKTADGKVEKISADLTYPEGTVNNPIAFTEDVYNIKISAGQKVYYSYSVETPLKVTLTAAAASSVTIKNALDGTVISGECSVTKNKPLVVELSAAAATTASLRVETRKYAISILGDSISTYDGITNNPQYNSSISSSASIYYPTSSSITDTFTLEDTYWQKIINAFSFELCVNNSVGGDRVTDKAVSRAQNLHNTTTKQNPDVILVYLGTNDLGHQEDAGITIEAFKAKYDEMLDVIKTKYPNAQVFCMRLLPEERSTDKPEVLAEFNTAIYNSAISHGYETISLGDTGWNYLADTYVDATMRVHPNKKGMQKIADAAIPQIEELLK